jgi:DNA uptake protein ComE-like DNA-binding protein
MGIGDRDYMRRPSTPAAGPVSALPTYRAWQKYLWGAIAVIVLLIAGTYLVREIRADSTPKEGDLIVNVNTATQKEIETIPGIGKVIAKQIIAGRPYKRIEDLLRVDGIAEFTLGKIRPYVKLEGETEER